MLIDINASIGHWPFEKTNCNTCKVLLERMNKFGVDVSLVSNMNAIFYKDTQSANEELFEEFTAGKGFKNRIVPFAVINPIYAGWKNDLEICTSKMGMKGIRLYPLYHDYQLSDPSCIELVKMARDRNLVIAIHQRMVENRAARSWMDLSTQLTMVDIISLVKTVSDAKYMILNITGGLYTEDNELFKSTDILFDTSGKGMGNLPGLISKFGKEKFAFGTHSPILDYLTGLLRIESMDPEEADESVKEQIRSLNAKRFLAL